MCEQHPGLIVRPHVFENYPQRNNSAHDCVARLSHCRIVDLAPAFHGVAQNSSAILGLAVPRHTLCSILDRTSAQVPRFLIFSVQNRVGKLYRVGK
jgi:hypothetical protein